MHRKNPQLAGTCIRDTSWYAPLRLAAIYALVAGAWIVFSDRLLLMLSVSAEQLTRFQTVKGGLFVAATAALLAWLVRRDLAAIQTEVKNCQAVQESFRVLVETIPHGLQENDSEGTITYTNAGYDRIFGIEPGSAFGTKIWDKQSTEAGRQALREYLDYLVREQPAPTPYLSHNRLDDGRVIDVKVDWDYLRDAAGQVIGFASVLTDITESRKAEESIRSSDRLKSELIRTAAHEFRTPLTTIQGFSELMLDWEAFPDSEKRDFVGCIHSKAVALSDMTESLLDLSRIEAGKPIPIRFVDCKVADLQRDITPLLKALQRRHPIEVDFAGAETALHADRGRIVQVLENLLENADKYSRSGSPIRLSGQPVDAVYRFEVSDRGIGIAAAELNQVFDYFYRADNSDTSPSGLGIGLAIVKHIVAAHGGQITIDSVAGQGTTFCFELPIRT